MSTTSTPRFSEGSLFAGIGGGGGTRNPDTSGGWPRANSFAICDPPPPTQAPPIQLPAPVVVTPDPAPTAPPAPVFVDTTPIGGGGELSFTGSQYGAPIPIVFGADKVAGNVIWAGPITTKSVQVEGKLLFYRTLDFCVAVAEGPINEVLRIWLGDKMVYNTVMEVDENDIPVPTADGYVNGFTVDVIDPDSPLAGVDEVADTSEISIFKGNEDQIPYGIMVNEEGFLNTPAYRGTAYIMFENFIVSSASMPNIFIEVAANSATSFPRAEAEVGVGGDFTVMNSETLLVDPALRNVYFGGDGGTFSGWIQSDSGSLAQIQEIEIEDQSIGVLGNTREWDHTAILPSGKLFVHLNKGTTGYGIVVEPNVGYVTSIYGPSVGGTFLDGVPGLITDLHPFTMASPDVEPADYLAITNRAGDLGIMEVNTRGEMYTQNRSLTTGIQNESLICFIEFNEAHYAKVPQFADDSTNALGGFLFWGGSASASSTTTFVLGKIPLGSVISDSVTLSATTMMTLDLDDLGGVGVTHRLVDMLPDADATIILFIVAQTGSDWLVKWDPRLNTIVWKAPCELSGQVVGDFATATRARMNGVRYSWINSNDDNLYTIDLKTGSVETTVENLPVAQTLPVNYGKSRQFYDSFEDSIYYFSQTPNKINKIWVGRTGNVSSSLQTVVKKLLERVGVSPADMNVSDFSAQSLRGYTVGSVQPIRSALADLRKAFTYEVVESNGRFQYISRGATAVVTIPNTRLGDSSGGGGFLPRTADNDISQLRKVNLTYKDFDREYKQSVQSVYIPQTVNLGFDTDAALGVIIPVALNATEAKLIADKLLYAKRVGEESFSFTTGFRYAFLDPGDVIAITVSATEEVLIRITNVRVGQDYRIEFEGVLEDPDIYNAVTGLTGSAGRFNKSQFKQPDPILLPYIMEIPCRNPSEFDTEASGQGNCYYTVLNPSGTGTTAAEYAMTLQYNVTNYITTQTPATYPTWGLLTEPMAVISNAMTPQADVSIVVKVNNVNASFPLASVTDMTALIDSTGGVYKNLAMLGNELIQFVTATDGGNGLWTLTGIIRGRFGTESYVNARAAGDKFILLTDSSGNLDEGSIMKIELPIIDALGVMKAGLGIVTNNPLQRTTYGLWTHLSKKPANVPNVDMTFDTTPDSYTITWPQRSRISYAYLDDGTEDSAFVLDESTLEYDIFLAVTDANISPFDSTTYLRKERVTAATYEYLLADQVTDGFDFTTQTLYVWVYQISSTVGDTLLNPNAYKIGPQV